MGLPAENVIQISKARSNKIRRDIKKAIDGINTNFMDLAEKLGVVHDCDLWEMWGFANFREYVEEELDMKYRRAAHFVQIWNKARELQIDKKDVEKIGWSKFSKIVDHLTSRNKKKLLSLAMTMSTRNLCRVLNSTPGRLGRPTKKRRFVVTVDARQYKEMERVVKRALVKTGADNRGDAAYNIFKQYTAA